MVKDSFSFIIVYHGFGMYKKRYLFFRYNDFYSSFSNHKILFYIKVFFLLGFF
jgi:hypothetical protein